MQSIHWVKRDSTKLTNEKSEIAMTVLKFFKVHPSIRLPEHQTTQSACFDLSMQGAGKRVIKGFTSMNKPIERLYAGVLNISPGDRMLIPTGFIIPEGFSVRIHARSGTSLKQGLILANSEGVIDSDYVEEVMVMLHNISENTVTIKDGDRIAQAELVKNETYTIEQTPVRPIPKTNRTGGFGSTGVASMTQLSNQNEIVVIKVTEDEKPIIPVVKRGRGRPPKNATSPS